MCHQNILKYTKGLLINNSFFSTHLCRVNDVAAITDSYIPQIEDGQELVLRLEEVCSTQTGFGKPSYIPLTEQTEKGLAKFYSILKYLVRCILIYINYCLL